MTADSRPFKEQIVELVELYNQGKHEETLVQGEVLAKQFPDKAFTPNLLGAVNVALGRLEQAVENFTQALQIKPDYAEAHANLGMTLYDLGKPKQAAVSFNNALQQVPDDAETLRNLGIALTDLREHEKAVVSLRQSLQLEPNNAYALNVLGIALNATGEHDEAVASYQNALQLSPDYAEAHTNLGIALNDSGRSEEAIDSHNKALQFRPSFASAENNLGIAFYTLGMTVEAASHYEKALLLNPERADWHRNLSTVKNYEDGDPQIEQMLEMRERPTLANRDRMQIGFALGKAYDDVANYDKAFSYVADANRLRKEELQYNIAADQALFEKIRTKFADDVPVLKSANHVENDAPQPVFILGMPRSGTSLVEQILASHSLVHGAGELRTLGNSINATQWKSIKVSPEQLKSIRQSYLSGLANLGTSKPIITDKMPHNFLSIGFIIAALPEARIIHVKRDARATCWSNFKHCFLSNGYGFTNSLQDVARYYQMYASLMAFWHQNFPGKIYDLDYDKLTDNQDDESRRLLDHVGLDWEDGCIDFHKTKRAVQTASANQVRQEMYQGSSQEWRKYEGHLTAMLELLEGY